MKVLNDGQATDTKVADGSRLWIFSGGEGPVPCCGELRPDVAAKKMIDPAQKLALRSLHSSSAVGIAGSEAGDYDVLSTALQE